ncbi:MAG: NUDIX hydrolase [Planctomycetota bacterium]|nr:NUDIX hydrolase [Planctomycetota bacterium]
MDSSDSGAEIPVPSSNFLDQRGCGSRVDPRFEAVAETLAHSGSRYQMYNLEERLPDGRIVSRDVIRHPGAAVILPVLPDGRIVLVEQHRSALGHNLLEIPAGLIDSGEQPEQCAERELREETGYRAGKITHMFDILPAAGFSDERMFIYLAEELQFVGQDTDEDEWVQTHICSREQLESLLDSGELIDGKTIVTLLHWFGKSR